jgi:hypothetical protein
LNGTKLESPPPLLSLPNLLAPLIPNKIKPPKITKRTGMNLIIKETHECIEAILLLKLVMIKK